MTKDKRRRRDGLALPDGGSDGTQQDAVQDSGDFLRVRRGSVHERVKWAEPGPGKVRRDPRDQAHDRAGVVRLQQQRHERQRRRRGRPLEHRHLQDQAAHPLRRLHRGEQAYVGAKRDPAQHHLTGAELVQQAQHLLRVQVHPVRASVPGLVAAAVAQQVEQYHAVAAGSKPTGQAPAEVGVEQQGMKPHKHPLARAVDLIGQPVRAVGQRALRAFTVRLRAFRRDMSPALARPGEADHGPPIPVPATRTRDLQPCPLPLISSIVLKRG